MTKDDIYDHLAQVYLGKRKQADEKRHGKYYAWLFVNILTAVLFFLSAFYGLTAFLTQKKSILNNNVIYSLNQGPLRMDFHFGQKTSPLKALSINVEQVNAVRYRQLHFSVRAKEEGSPGVVKIVLRNQRNETSSFYIRDVGLDWKEYTIPLESFKHITDWTNLMDLSFVLEAWNVSKEKGLILIDDVFFSG